ncbi:MAG: class II aldolase/adducin family protein [Deltaproteobacteria bacterium]|nr:class II aldolase/adducin family protein [Deltaproteobacteria bacterium]
MTTEDSAELKEQVALANRALHHYGLASYMGHASARIPGTDRVLIRPRSYVGMDQVTAGMIVTIDLEGNIIDAPGGARVPDGWSLHTEIYKARPDVGGVAHTHQKWCTVFGIAGQTILPVHHPSRSSVVYPAYGVYDHDSDTATVDQGRAVAKALGSGVGCHLRNHGVVIVGIDVQEAVAAAVNAEHQAEMNWLAMQAGEREEIPERYMRRSIERRFVRREKEKHEGIERDNWGNLFTWADQDREVVRFRRVQL